MDNLQANSVRVKTFQSHEEEKLDEKVNEWLKNQKDEVVVCNVLYGHGFVVSDEIGGWSFSLSIVYGRKPKT